MEYFVRENSIVRQIWGKSDTILFIFAGSAAEFALNKAVDWLYFTGRLPADPMGRLFSTVSYARKIIFSKNERALHTIDGIDAIHKQVELNRNDKIPAWAYRDVLYMLIHYSIAAYELLNRKLTSSEKEEVFDVFYRFGKRMHLKNLPENYQDWIEQRKSDMMQDLERSELTDDLFRQYKKHLGPVRYYVLIQSQKLIVPAHVRKLLGLSRFSTVAPLVPIYKWSRKFGLDRFIKKILLPKQYEKEIGEMEMVK